MPVLNIKDPEAYRLAADLARLTGKSLTRVVVDALKTETQRTALQPKKIDYARIRAIQDRVATKLTGSHRTPEEIIGYDARGLPE
ncbi:MAG: type II toxin-antitoxin system VapB family antitoxin [Bryobacteraceae bacterium]